MNITKIDQPKYILFFVRLALGFAFLSAVADRFGLWGQPGMSNVAWGDFKAFEAYVSYLNPYLSGTVLSIVSWGVTLLEIVLGVLLIFGIKLEQTAFISAVLLLSFALSMSIVMGIKVPFDYSVFSASAGAFLLYLFVREK